MGEYKCTQMERIKALEEAINGNGTPGLKQVVARLDVTVQGVTEVIRDNATVQSALLKFMNEERGKDKEKVRTRLLIGTLITLSLGVLGLAITLLTK